MHIRRKYVYGGKLIDDIVKTNSTNYLTEAGKRFVSNIKIRMILRSCLRITGISLLNMNPVQTE